MQVRTRLLQQLLAMLSCCSLRPKILGTQAKSQSILIFASKHMEADRRLEPCADAGHKGKHTVTYLHYRRAERLTAEGC